MLDALLEAAQERDKAAGWTMQNAQLATLQELVHKLYRVMHMAHMQGPHPAPDWEAFRPDHIRKAAEEEKAKPLTGRQFLAHILGKR